MPTKLLNFPIGLIVDGMLSFIQSRFSNPAITPAEYRWNSDDTQSRIRISSTYPVDNAKPGSIPFIIVRRSGFQFAIRGLNNLASADANVMTNPKYEDWSDGSIDILCEAGTASEASSLANYLAIEIQANRHAIKEVLKFVRFISYADVGPEMLVESNVEPRRWQVMLRIRASVYLGWVKRQDAPPWNKLRITDIDPDNTWKSDSGELKQGQSYITDQTADFGVYNTNSPQLLESELNKKWYYVLIGKDERLYPVEEIMNNHQLRLSDRNDKDQIIPFNPTQDSTTSYKIAWNTIHFDIEMQKSPSN